MRRDIVHRGASQLKYEIREIVDVAHKINAMGQKITWENIGDPVQKGEPLPDWIKQTVQNLAGDDKSYAYNATAGNPDTRIFLANRVNERGGCKITENDIIFFNGLGDAVSTLFSYLKRESRVLGPSPAYSTLSSAEAAHSGYEHTTYKLDPENNWNPDLEDIRLKAKFNDAIAGILLINPDNPTGCVYTKETLLEIVDIARKNDLFVICDETYARIVYNGAKPVYLSDVIEDVPGIALRSISKEYPWPGGRCGWMEVYNQDKDKNFSLYIKSILDAKRLEVCSTSLPQLTIPLIFTDARYDKHLEKRNTIYASRAKEAVQALNIINGVNVIPPQGAFYLTVLIDEQKLSLNQYLKIDNSEIRCFIEDKIEGVSPDKRFVYYLLAAEGICVVPLTGFCSKLTGFRMTLLENNDEKRRETLKKLSSALTAYLSSCQPEY